VNDLFVILSREETAERVSVIEAEERVEVPDWTCKRLWRYEWVAILECFIGDRENFEVDTLINFQQNNETN